MLIISIFLSRRDVLFQDENKLVLLLSICTPITMNLNLACKYIWVGLRGFYSEPWSNGCSLLPRTCGMPSWTITSKIILPSPLKTKKRGGRVPHICDATQLIWITGSFTTHLSLLQLTDVTAPVYRMVLLKADSHDWEIGFSAEIC